MHNYIIIINGANNISQIVGWLSFIQACGNWKEGPNLSHFFCSALTHVSLNENI